MTTEQKVTRKLSAILSADVKGYSLLMTNDETSTIKTLKEYRNIMSEIIKQYSGRVVDTPGDNLLAEFSSAVNAVQCSVEIQKELKERNDDLADDKRLEFRIGVNIGDVVQDGDSLYGEGVNIAARIEGLADPGGVCISRGVYDHIRNKLGFGYEYLGDHTVKNIKQPVRVYKVLMDPEDAGKLIGEKPKPIIKSWVWSIIVVAAIVLTLIGYQLFQKITAPEFEQASIEKMAFPLPEKPSIAVLPFDNMSEDKDQDYFCDGITEEIISALSKSPKIFVIARNSTFTYKGKAIKVQQIAEELGVHYVLEGSVRKSGDRLRITAQLIDALTGYHLWTERYDRDLKEIFALQDEITIKIISALQVKLTDGEIALIEGRGTQNLEAYLKVLKAGKEIQKVTKEGYAQARRLCEEAIVLDPDYAMAYRYLGATHWMDVTMGTSKSPKASIKLAFDSLKKSKALNDSLPLPILGFLYVKVREYDKGVAECEKAVALAPNSGNANIWMSLALTVVGRHKEAVRYAEQALRLDPLGPPWYSRSLGYVYSWVGRYEEAITAYKKAMQSAPNDLLAHIHLTITYIWAGLLEEARAQGIEILRIKPNFTVGQHAKALTLKDKADQERYFGALLKAGLPENPPIPLPDKPSIAVLAFDNMSGDKEQEYFSDGITEGIITTLSKTDQLLVIARNSTFTYKGKPVKIKQVAEELGVRYVLEGSVQKSEDQVRITAQLIDATTGHHLWAKRYDRDLKDIFALQDEITMKIVTALQVKLTMGEQARMMAKKYKTLDVQLKAMELVSLWDEGTMESLVRHGQVAQELIDMAPELQVGYRSLGYNYWYLASAGKSPQENLGKASELAQKALSLDESDSLSHALLGSVYLQARQYEKAIAAGKRSIELAPNGAYVHVILGDTLTFAGRPDEAIRYINKGIRLDPISPYWYFEGLGRCYFSKAQYENALTEFKKALQLAPEAPQIHGKLAITYILLDREEDARASATKCLEIAPWASVGLTSKVSPLKDKTELKLILDAMRKAGFPE